MCHPVNARPTRGGRQMLSTPLREQPNMRTGIGTVKVTAG
jgi:hypothetical protein